MKTRILQVSLAAAAAALIVAGPARADAEFDVNVSQGQVVVTAKGDWHINQDFPWKVVAGGAKIGKDKFSLSEKTASVPVPSGAVHVHGAVCSKDACHTLDRDVTVP